MRSSMEPILAQWIGFAIDSHGRLRGSEVLLDSGGSQLNKRGRVSSIHVNPDTLMVHIRLEPGSLETQVLGMDGNGPWARAAGPEIISIRLKEGVTAAISPDGEFRYPLSDTAALTILLA